MNVQELRIGNYIEQIDIDLGNKDQPVGIIQCSLHDLWNITNGRGLLYRPISLTEQWLKDLGMSASNQFVAWGVKSNIKSVGVTESVFLVLGGDEWRFAICEIDSAYPVIDDEVPAIKYVHQLQNLYFSLVGTELTCAPQS